MISSDSQAMGRVGESFMRAFQMASYMKSARGRLKEDAAGNDNFRVLRYLAKITINPAITLGVWANGRMKSGEALGYMLFQVIGAINCIGRALRAGTHRQ